MMGSQGTPIVAVEGGIVEAMGWNKYGGWRIGIRSFDSKRYYYYAHLQKDHPFAEGLQEGDIVQAGDLIGFMGRTGYSDKENVNNIETVHLHFGMELVIDESQKECNSEIWIDTYSLVRLLQSHRSTVVCEEGKWKRKFGFVDLDILDQPCDNIFVEN
jgi:murein DD-endopeptidase MepM/ murein hydrolase activator NlpD